MHAERVCLCIFGLCGSLLSACSPLPPVEVRQQTAEHITQQANWQPQKLTTERFTLQAYLSPLTLPTSSNTTLTLYIEGDGLAWRTRHIPSTNPTPINPLGLKLAVEHPSGPAAYLARPCQFVAGEDRRNCTQNNWTAGRYSLTTIESTLQAIDQLKAHYGAKKVILVGYSGGGAIASLTAAQRTDVIGLITVAGNLDHRIWTELHNITPLNASLNPADFAQQLKKIPQLHLVGSEDQQVPPPVAYSYLQQFQDQSNIHVEVIPKFTHQCCWVENWPALLKMINQQPP